MSMTATSIVAILAVFLQFFAVPTILLAFLQRFLCGKDLKWGRVLPILSLVVSVLVALFLLLGMIPAADVIPALLTLLLGLVLFNIPTLVYYLIYRAAKKKKRQQDLERMKIDDLE